MNDIVVEVIDGEEVRSRVLELGKEVAAAYADTTPLLIGVLSGSVPFMADLSRAMDVDVEMDFIALSRFGQGGQVRFVLDTSKPLDGRDVLIVEDIIDTGLTLQTMIRTFLAREARSVRTVTLLNKASRRIVDVPVDFRGFDVGDEFLIGYGLDWRGRYRNLSSVWAVLDVDALESRHAEVDRELFAPVGDNLRT